MCESALLKTLGDITVSGCIVHVDPCHHRHLLFRLLLLLLVLRWKSRNNSCLFLGLDSSPNDREGHASGEREC